MNAVSTISEKLAARSSVASTVASLAGCSHCGSEVPRAFVEPGGEYQFCCGGCRTAFELIHASGLEAFYERNLPSREPVDGQATKSSFADFDTTAFEQLYIQELPSGERRVTLALTGLHCAACIWLLEKLPQISPGVRDATVNWGRSTIIIIWQPQSIALSQIAAIVCGLGYGLSPVRQGASQSAAKLENRRRLRSLGIALAAASNNMLIGATLYFGLVSELGMGIERLLRVASCLIGLVSLLGPGRVYFASAIAAIRTRTPHVDIPVALALAVGGCSGVINILRGAGEIYFDSLSGLVALLLVGRYLQFRQQRHTAEAVDLLYRLTPRTARRVVNGQATETLSDLLQPGDCLEVLPGEIIPADGRTLGSQSLVQESLLTGESRAIAKSPGDYVFAGTQNLRSPLRLIADRVGRETRMGHLMESMEAASLHKPPLIEWANRVGGWFVAAVIAIGLMTFLVWISSSWTAAVDNAVAVLIVACPCVFALAAPISLSVAIGRAARNGILIKGGDVLQRLSRSGILWLDKTGTVTHGRMRLADWFGDQSILPSVAALESRSTHPIAAAFDAQAVSVFLGRIDEISTPIVEQVVVLPGGIVGTVNGHRVAIGNQHLIQTIANPIPVEMSLAADRFAEASMTPVFVAMNSSVVGVAAVGDTCRQDSLQAIQQLRDLHWEIGLLSGDHPQLVEATAQQLGLVPAQAIGNATPEAKVEIIRQSQMRGGGKPIVMVGDGVNDTAALAAASVGIAVKGGAEACLAAASVYLNQPGISPIVDLLRASRQTMRTIYISLAISICYNCFSVGLATLGLVHPLVAAVLMPISSLTVVLLAFSNPAFRNGNRLRAIEPGSNDV